MTPRFCLPPLAVACIAVAAAVPAQAQPAPAFDISLASQPLGDALNDLARQTGMQLIVRPDMAPVEPRRRWRAG